MSENLKSGQTVNIRVFVYDGTAAITGLTPALTIERLSDNQFWNGAAWQAAHTTVAMAELTPSNSHNDGTYEYDFATEAAPTENVYDWSVVHSLGSRKLISRGRIRTYDL